MRAQLERLHTPVAAPQHRRPRAAPLPAAPGPRSAAHVAPPASRPEEPRAALPGRDRGLGLLMAFTGAVSVMVADVVLVGAVAQSWILIPGFAVLLLMTAIVFAEIMRLLADGGEEAVRDAR
jgi:hypothetical protein